MSGDHGEEKPWDLDINRLMSILRRLPVLEAEKEHLLHAAIELSVVAVMVDEHRKLPRIRNEEVRAELQTLARLCDQVVGHIQSMQQPVLEYLVWPRSEQEDWDSRPGIAERVAKLREKKAWEVDHPSPFDIAERLAKLKQSAIDALSLVSGPAGGRPPSQDASIITTKAITVYERLTGNPATRRARDGRAEGPFLNFLAELFPVLGINASPESQAKTALKVRKKLRNSAPS